MTLNMLVGSRPAGLSVSETVDLLGFPHITVSRLNPKEWPKNINYPVTVARITALTTRKAPLTAQRVKP